MIFETVIVEDDPMVAMLNRSFIEQDPRFHVAAEFRDGKTALSWLSSHFADLAILDVFMPAMTGFELLRELRRREIHIDAVMVTAANDAKTLDQCLKMGVVDYLIKPFTMQRFRQALENFCQVRRAVQAEGSMSQDDIDKLFASAPEGETTIPKGLQEKTMERIRTFLSGTQGRGLTSEEVAVSTGLSTVTARRYLNHLLETGEVVGQINYDTGGRPSVAYHLLSNFGN